MLVLLQRELNGASVISHLFVVKKPNYCLVTESFGVACANKKVSGQILFFEIFPE